LGAFATPPAVSKRNPDERSDIRVKTFCEGVSALLAERGYSTDCAVLNFRDCLRSLGKCRTPCTAPHPTAERLTSPFQGEVKSVMASIP
jgi:hypothetical protein